MDAAWLWVGCGSALGGVGRYACTLAVEQGARSDFPWGTLTVNLLGSALIGLLAVLAWTDGRALIDGPMRVFLLIGVLGGFTTFSSFSLQSLGLMQAGDWWAAAAYVLGSVLSCLAGVWAGTQAGNGINFAIRLLNGS